jgi:hypothetical protein
MEPASTVTAGGAAAVKGSLTDTERGHGLLEG